MSSLNSSLTGERRRSVFDTDSPSSLHGLGPDRASRDRVRDFITHWADRRQHLMRHLERQAFLQLAWTIGHQNHEYGNATGELIDRAGPDESPWWAIHAIENRLLIAVEARLAKLTARWPVWKARPVTTDDEDQEVAAGQDRVLKHYWNTILEMDERLWAAHWFAEVTGTAFLLTIWNPDDGPLDTVTPDRFKLPGEESGLDFFQQIFGQDAGPPGEAGLSEVKVPIGDVAVEVLTLFEVFLDPSARRIDDAEWMILSRLRSPDHLLQRYPRHVLRDVAVGVDPHVLPYHDRLLALTRDHSTGSIGGSLFEDLILTHELWIKPSRARPDGVHAVVAGDVLLRSQPFPYKHRQLPLSVIQGIPVPTGIWGTSAVAQLMEAQNRLNDIRSTKTEYLRMHVYPKVLAPIDASVDEDAFTTEFGEVIEYGGQVPPHFLHPPPLPGYLENIEQHELRAFQDLSHIHEVTQGKAPSGTKSGRAILSLQAQDDAMFGPIIRLRNKTLNRVGSQTLSLLHQFATERRYIQVAGDDLERELGLFSDLAGFIGAELVGPKNGRPGIDYFRVWIDQESGLPLSPEGQRVIISDLAESGFLNPQTDRDMVLRLNGLAASDPIMQQEQVHHSRAVIENRAMARGQRVDPRAYEGHITHLRVHQRFMNGTEYRRLPVEQQQLFELHLDRHYLLQATELQRPQVTMQAAQPIAQQIVGSGIQAIQTQGPAPPDIEGDGQADEEDAGIDADPSGEGDVSVGLGGT